MGKKGSLRQVDFIIVGQGLAGSLLAYELIKREKSVVLIDECSQQTSSRRAAGIYNPITGRKMVKTWMADDLFSILESYYSELENELNSTFLHKMNIYRPFASVEEQNDWQGRLTSQGYDSFVKDLLQDELGIPYIQDPAGGLMLQNSGYVDLPILINSFREYFKALGVFQNEVFNYEQLTEQNGSITYKEFTSRYIIFCDGVGVMRNPYFSDLKFRIVKGELLKLKSTFNLKQIVNRGVFMIPRDGKIQVGSTYNHDDLTWESTDEGRSDLIERLSKIYIGEKVVENQTAGLRPATFDRRPFLGWSSKSELVGIFNGLGAKGVSLAPYWSQKMAEFVLGKEELPAEVALYR